MQQMLRRENEEGNSHLEPALGWDPDGMLCEREEPFARLLAHLSAVSAPHPPLPQHPVFSNHKAQGSESLWYLVFFSENNLHLTFQIQIG